ncbi:MAG: undecaprenyl-diphosphatase UppP [Patescibacteria group bacterium]
MEIIQAAILGIVQGLTEFFPISSSGHLIIIPKLFNWQGVVDSLSFDVALHLGTALALIIFFWKDWIKLTLSFIKKLTSDRRNLIKDENSRLFIFLFLASFPAGIVGFLFQDFIEQNFRSTLLVGATLIIFGILLWYFDKKGKTNKNIKEINLKDAIFIGMAQAISLIPGVSRSGVTITMARALNIDRESAVRFSFLLSTPAIIGAGFVSSRKIFNSGIDNLSIFSIGFIAAMVSGLFAIKVLLYLAKRQDFNLFVIYRILLGIFLIIFSFIFG